VPALFEQLYPDVKIPSKKKDDSTTRTRLPKESKHSQELSREDESASGDLGDKAEPADSFALNIDGKAIKVEDQIHLYATNKQVGRWLVWKRLTESANSLLTRWLVRPCSRRLQDYRLS